MADVWSFNTTVRNPERMENMLRALNEMEGVDFDLEGQEKFFGLLIKKRLYKPTKAKLAETDLIAAVHSGASADDLDGAIVERILLKYKKDPVNASGRGRTPAGILNRFGLCVALQSQGPVVITGLGKKWLANEIDDEELFTKFFLKWQYPNRIEAGYEGFDIKPFVGLILLIQKVNQKWEALGNKPVGLSKQEYLMFVPALTTASKLEDYANQIIEFRSKKRSKSGKDQSNFVNEYTNTRAQQIYGPSKPLHKALNDLRDYTDSSIRYFRVSGLIALRGGDTHIDIARDKEVEAASIASSISAQAAAFDSYETYLKYISDINSLEFPWHNETDLQKISEQLSHLVKEEAGAATTETGEYLESIKTQTPQQQVSSLTEAINDIRISKLKELRHDVSVLEECIDKLGVLTSRQYEPLTARPSLDLEWYVTRALMVLNDAIEVMPSFKIGDDGLPTGFRSNISDIECHYESFGMTVEVTLKLGRDQWIAEGQPVMRHLRDFEDSSEQDRNFCIFVAPLIHRDTLNTFWNSNKFSYEGKRQNIVPLTIEQFGVLLRIAKTKIENGSLSHRALDALLHSFCSTVDDHDNPNEWIGEFSACIDRWAREG